MYRNRLLNSLHPFISWATYCLRPRAHPCALLVMALDVRNGHSVRCDTQNVSLRVISRPCDCDEQVIDDWVALLTSASFSATRKTFSGEFSSDTGLALALAYNDNRLIATAGLRRLPSNAAEASLITFVAVAPNHRGQKLGTLVTKACIDVSRQQGRDIVFLLTDDFRLAAIKTYWMLGFRPTLATWDRSHHFRWRRICRRLSLPFACASSESYTTLLKGIA